ncbi:MAG: hypothetical protein ACRDFB_01640 [Rhabdochlamydiaceae bacterium]
MSKEVPRGGTRSLAMKLEKCQDCSTQLEHDYYTEQEAKSRGMNLNFQKQRNSLCPKCKILYIISK